MLDVHLTLLGPPRLVVSEKPDAAAHLSAKALGILAFLALEPGPHARDELAALLWSDSTTAASRASLRQALRQLRATLGDAIHVDRQQVELDAAVRCDVRAFLHASREAPEQAAEYAVDRFLAGFSVRHASGFDEWTDSTRQRLLRAARDALRTATTSAIASSRWRDAAWWAERWTAHDSLSDEAVRHLAEACYMSGDRGEALGHIQAYRERLHENTGAEPSPALEDLAARIADETNAESGTIHPNAEAWPAETRLDESTLEPPLIGREAEWRRLVRAWDDVAAGNGRVVLVEGETGVGKTRIAEEVLHWAVAQGATVLRGRGYDPETGLGYAPIVEALRSGLDAPGLASAAPAWLAELGRLVPGIHDRFPRLPEPSAPGETDRRWRLFESAAQALLGMASERPTIVFIDDVQRCDGDTCALLHFLIRRLDDAAVMILVSVTLGDVSRATPAARLCRAIRSNADRTTVLTLAPLSETDVWQVIRTLGNITRPDGARRFAAQVHQVTDGNPFHLLELLKSLFAQGMLAIDPASGEWVAGEGVDAEKYHLIRMPRTVHDAVAERCARLPYELRDLLVTTAVAGQTTTDVLSHVHGMSRLRAAALADALVERRLLTEKDGVYRCAHPIIQDVTRADLTPARRREVHRATALALDVLAQRGEAPGVAGEIARHADRGGERDLAFASAIAASEAAVADGDYDEALSWLDLAARAADAATEVEAVNERTAHILQQTGWPKPPRPPRAVGTPARGFARGDLDLG